MPAYCEIRADDDRDTIVVYQAYNDAIADAALRAGRFVPPFLMGRMTWIKPSFLWMMERGGWNWRNPSVGAAVSPEPFGRIACQRAERTRATVGPFAIAARTRRHHHETQHNPTSHRS